MSHNKHVRQDSAHATECHRRWLALRNRKMEESGYQDDWYSQQCGACRYWIPLDGVMGNDYGGCTNGRSAFDKHLMFEHDGCDAFDPAGEWADDASR